jgi:hypothetical protein
MAAMLKLAHFAREIGVRALRLAFCSYSGMIAKIKALKMHLARLEDVLIDPTGKPHPKIAGEILNAHFELKQLLIQSTLQRRLVK